MCLLTLHSDHWTLTASGPAYETGDASLMAVTGGTGAYANVRGYLVATLAPDGASYTVRLNLQVAPTSYWQGIAWHELTAAEAAAWTTLGWQEATWNAQNIRVPEGDVELYWSCFAWEELRMGEQQLFAYLGWNPTNWTGDAPIPESKYRVWDALSPVEQGAATQLGYDAATWDSHVLAH